MLPFESTHFPAEESKAGAGCPVGEEGPPARTLPENAARCAHPYLPGVGGARFSLMTEWDDLVLAVRCVWEPPRGGARAKVWAGLPWALHDDPLRRPSPIASPDDFFEALRFAFDRYRAAVLVSIRRGRVVLFQPFANDRAFRAWTGLRGALLEAVGGAAAAGSAGSSGPGIASGSPAHTSSPAAPDQLDVRVPEDDLADAVRRYALLKARAVAPRHRPEPLIEDPDRWWRNGHVVCNVRPPNVWGEFQLAEYLSLFQRAAALEPALEVDFLLNRRDAPLLAGRALAVAGPMLPVLSAYTSERCGDLPVPLADDWRAALAHGSDRKGWVSQPHANEAGGGAHPPVAAPVPDPAPDPVPVPDPAPVPVPFALRPDARAVFRGSSTGRGVTPETNLRMRTCLQLAAEGELFDCKITRVNLRDQLLGDRLVHPRAAEIHEALVAGNAWGEYMSLEAQAARYRVALYMRGHQAASRFGALFRHGFLVVALHPDDEAMDAPGWRPWFWHHLHPYDGWRRWRDARALLTPGPDDVFCVCRSVPELVECCRFMRDHPDVARTVAEQGWERVGRRLLGAPDRLARAAADAMCAAAALAYPQPPSHYTHPLFGVTNFEAVAKRSVRLDRG